VTKSFKQYLESKQITVNIVNSPVAIVYGKAVNINSFKFRTEKDVEEFANNKAIHSIFLYAVVPFKYIEPISIKPSISIIARMYVVHQNSKMEEFNIDLMNIKKTPVKDIDTTVEKHSNELLE
jgi:hypothetical protein